MRTNDQVSIRRCSAYFVLYYASKARHFTMAQSHCTRVHFNDSESTMYMAITRQSGQHLVSRVEPVLRLQHLCNFTRPRLDSGVINVPIATAQMWQPTQNQKDRPCCWTDASGKRVGAPQGPRRLVYSPSPFEPLILLPLSVCTSHRTRYAVSRL